MRKDKPASGKSKSGNYLIQIQYPFKSVYFSRQGTTISDDTGIRLAEALLCSPEFFISNIRANPNLIIYDSIFQLAIRFYQRACEDFSYPYFSAILNKAGLSCFIPKRKKGRPRKGANITRGKYETLKKRLKEYGLITDRDAINDVKTILKERNQNQRVLLHRLNNKVKNRMSYLTKFFQAYPEYLKGLNPPPRLNDSTNLTIKVLALQSLLSASRLAQMLLTDMFDKVSERTFKARLKD